MTTPRPKDEIIKNMVALGFEHHPKGGNYPEFFKRDEFIVICPKRVPVWSVFKNYRFIADITPEYGDFMNIRQAIFTESEQ